MARESLHSLVYASEESWPLDAGDLESIMAASIAWNGKVGLTGMLLNKDGAFMQVLEGPERMVRKTFRFIRKDKRHR